MSEQTLAWNDKYLDYEIETDIRVEKRAIRSVTWNDKYLDYEIETGRLSSH